MFNCTRKELIEGITKAEKDESYFLVKKLVSKENMPGWAEMLDSIYLMADQPLDEELDAVISKDIEKLIGRLLVSKGVYLTFKATQEENDKMFPKIKEMVDILRGLKDGFQIQFYGPKVSVGPHFIGPHQDSWHAATLQCEGNTIWSLKHEDKIEDKTKLIRFDREDSDVSVITLEPGDFLYFSQKLFHQIEVSGPRGSLLFNSRGLVKEITN